MLHHNKETFEQVILRVANDKGIAPEIIEKDYYVVSRVVVPTCEDKGYTVYICECGHTYDGDKKAALGHNYDGNNCKVCGESKIENCSHMCHKNNFIWKILRFFFKLFKMQPVCDCGAKHY